MRILALLSAVLVMSCNVQAGTATPEETFWKWFQANEKVLFDYERDQEAIFDHLGTEMHKVNPNLTFEFGPKENGKREFVISADGIREAFPAVEALYAVAPALPRWKFNFSPTSTRAVSNTIVNRWVNRCVRILLVLLIVLFLATLGSYARATWFRTESERLFKDVKMLRVGVSGFDDAKHVADKYSKHLTIESGRCVPKECSFYIRLLKTPLLYSGACCDTDFGFARKMGIRPSLVAAEVSVRDGVVTAASFSIDYRTGRGDWLMASSKAISSFGLLDKADNLSLQLHPNFAVKFGNITTVGGGAFITAAYTPQATSNERAVVSDIRLSCMTDVPDCRDLSDVMPQAARVYVSDLRWIEANSSTLSPLRDRLFQELQEKYGSPPWNAATSF